MFSNACESLMLDAQNSNCYTKEVRGWSSEIHIMHVTGRGQSSEFKGNL